MATRSSIEINFRGERYVGQYEITGRVIRVSYGGETKVGILRGLEPELLARILLVELVTRVVAAKTSTAKPFGNT
jgi:hypothetical protein